MSTSQYEIIYNICMEIFRFKELRIERGKTQSEIAQFLNIRQNTYSQYENGQRQISIEALIKLAKYYDVSVDYLLGLTEIENPY